MFPIKQEFDDYSALPLSTATEKSFGSALASMSPGDILQYGADDDYEYMLDGGRTISGISGPFSKYALDFDWLMSPYDSWQKLFRLAF